MKTGDAENLDWRESCFVNGSKNMVTDQVHSKVAGVSPCFKTLKELQLFFCFLTTIGVLFFSTYHLAVWKFLLNWLTEEIRSQK